MKPLLLSIASVVLLSSCKTATKDPFDAQMDAMFIEIVKSIQQKGND